MDTLLLIPVILGGYLCGSFPTGVVLARLFGWPDPRQHGSGHTGGLNASRSGGIPALVMVALVDITKGVLAVQLIPLISDHSWAIPLAGMAAVIGHNWPVWLNFKGGMGLATSAGAVGSFFPIVVLAAALAWLVLYAIIRHQPRATFAAMLLVPLWLFLLKAEPTVFWLATLCAAVAAARYLGDWNRVYE